MSIPGDESASPLETVAESLGIPQRQLTRCVCSAAILPPPDYFVSIDAVLRTYKARHQLAQLRLQQGRQREAEELCLQALSEQPHFVPAWQELAELYLMQRRWPEVEQVIARLANNGKIDAAILQARACLDRGTYGLIE